MSLHERRTVVPGGVGELPLGYELRRDYDQPAAQLVVIGNYEETLRDHYGMHQFERYRSNFIAALEYATTAECSVLMEGGLTRRRRLETEEGKRFCDGLLTIWLCPANAARCMRVGLTDEQYHRSHAASIAVAKTVEDNGAEVHRTCHREDALKWVCDVVDDRLDYRRAAVFQTDYR
jgi:hypothetical protein